MVTPYWRARAEECAGTSPAMSSALADLVALESMNGSAPRQAVLAAGAHVLTTLAGIRPTEIASMLDAAPRESVHDLACHGTVAQFAGLLAPAMASLGQAELRLRDSSDPWLRLHVATDYSRTCSRLGDLSRAARSYQDALRLAQGVGDRRMEALHIANLGYLYGEQDEAVPYEEYTRRALAIFREIGDAQLTAHCLCNLGGALARMGRLGEAAAVYDEGWALAQGMVWPRGHALFLAGLGGLRMSEGRLDDGEASYLESIRILQGIGDAFQVARHWFILGRDLVEAGEPARALGPLRTAIGMAVASAYASTHWQCLEYLSRALEATGDVKGALTALRAHVVSRGAQADARVEERVRAAELSFSAERARSEAQWARERTVVVERHNEELAASLTQQQALHVRLETQARTDVLTGLANRRAVQDALTREIARCRRHHRPLAVVLLDVDHFKAINDAHGHAVGDEILVQIGARLRAAVRGCDLVGRWGGEEFCLLLVDTHGGYALATAERIAAAVSSAPFETTAGSLRVSASLGLADLRAESDDLEAVLRRADAALHAAKRTGRARVVADPGPPVGEA